LDFIGTSEKYSNISIDVSDQQDATNSIYWYIECTDIAAGRQVGSNIGTLYQKLYLHSESAPEDERVCRPKRVELI